MRIWGGFPFFSLNPRLRVQQTLLLALASAKVAHTALCTHPSPLYPLPFPFAVTGDSPWRFADHSGWSGEVTVRGVGGHSGQSKGDHSASKPGSSLCSSPFVRHGSATRGS